MAVLARLRATFRNEAGQAMVIFALAAVMIFGIAAIAIDGGLEFKDKRELQSAADLGSLAGAGLIEGSQGSGGATEASIVSEAQRYAWQNLGVAPIGGTGCTSSPCKISDSGYTVTATNSYNPCAAVPVPPCGAHTENNPLYGAQAVAVDVTHDNPTSFARVLGIGSVHIVAHAAANAPFSIGVFPYALAARFLEIHGGSTVTGYGSTLVSQCSHGGDGGFSIGGGAGSMNGGFLSNGSTTYAVGKASSSPGVYTSAQAFLLADAYIKGGGAGGTIGCPGAGNPNHSTQLQQTWTPPSQMHDFVCFFQGCETSLTNNPGVGWNATFGFDAGQNTTPTPPCANSSLPDTCSPSGNGSWQDPSCWSDAPNGALAPIVAVNEAWDAATSSFDPSPVIAANPSCVNNQSREGSYLQSRWPGFPGFPRPETTLDSLLSFARSSEQVPSEGVTKTPASCGGGLTGTSGSNPPVSPGGTYYCGSGSPTPSITLAYGSIFNTATVAAKARLTFSPGYYIFQGPNASLNLSGDSGGKPKITSGIECHGPITPAVPGCVFIFRDGATLNLGASELFCADPNSVAGPNLGDDACSFQFEDQGAVGSNYPNPSTLTLNSSINAFVRPIQYKPPPSPGLASANCLGTAGADCMPIIWSNDANNCLGGNAPPIPAGGPCAITFANASATLDVGGTIFAPNGIVSIGSNAKPASGQLMADTITMTGGAGGTGGAAYNGALISPIGGIPFLFE